MPGPISSCTGAASSPSCSGQTPVLDYILANLTLLFDLDRAARSEELVELAQTDLQKLPRLAPSGVAVGTVSPRITQELGLPTDVPIVRESHNQCANAVGCGVFPNYETGVDAMIRLDRTFDPDPAQQERYVARFEEYRRLFPLMKGYLKELHRTIHLPNA